MDLLPSGPIQDPAKLAAVRRAQELVVDELFEGEDYRSLATRLAKGDQKMAKRWRTRIRRWARWDPHFNDLIGLATRGELILGLPGMATALNRRGHKGNVPAQKLAMEATGFYSPRIDHKHSGDIAITIHHAGRPPVVDDTVVADAEEIE